jgi:hypothetical protein
MSNQEKVNFLSEVVKDLANKLVDYGYWDDGKDDADWFCSNLIEKMNK